MNYKTTIVKTFSLFFLTALIVSCGYFGYETRLKEDIDYVVEIENGKVIIRNYSDHKITIVKIAGTNCDGKKESISWGDQINYLAGRTIYPGTAKTVIGLGDYKCFYRWVGY